ncbi:MAG: hypothetical protein M2R45_04894 [Verrucomicrobia subdivision 3 bacterium]|nr:hypothetical protein [Limisphaerales bacterium]MCS1417548.1 hypothetical protein [Limisphaerales bacterium]
MLSRTKKRSSRLLVLLFSDAINVANDFWKNWTKPELLG